MSPNHPAPAASDHGAHTALQSWVARASHDGGIPIGIIETEAGDHIAKFRWMADAKKAVESVNAHHAAQERIASLEAALQRLLTSYECVWKDEGGSLAAINKVQAVIDARAALAK